MGKIICDICGTSYPDTASHCPICGCAKPVDAESVTMTDSLPSEDGGATYTYVKGGRFSKGNVRKRNKAAQASRGRREEPEPEKSGGKLGVGVIITLIVMLAIIAVLGFFAVKYLWPGDASQPSGTEAPQPSTTVEPSQSETTESPSYPCTDLIVSDQRVELVAENNAYLLNVTPEPANTTDVISFVSSNPDVATVTQDGRITAVTPGQAVIVITCGEVVRQCQVDCTFEEETTAPTTEATTLPDEEFKLNREDITLSRQGETWQLYDGTLSPLQITWTTDDPAVATIEGGVVKGVGHGTTKVHGEYNGVKVSCIIRCSF